jgi:3-hydroxyacyl-[acyl-carrier-protein] dehydratase
MALLDRVESYDRDERRITGIKLLGQNEPTLAGYLPDHRVFPGTLIIEVLAQTCGLLMNVEHHLHRGARLDHPDDIATLPPPPLSVLAGSKVAQRGLARAGDEIRLDCRVSLQRRELYSFEVRASCHGSAIAEGTILLAYPAYMVAPPGAAQAAV